MFCRNCGNKIVEGAKFCNSCGASLEEPRVVNVNANITKREIVLCIVLSLITCGIYGLVWFVLMTNESNNLSDEATANGALAILYTILTCGIYAFYWNYKMGKKMYNAGVKYGKNIDDNSVLYLVLSLFGLTVVNYCLIQNDLNKFSE